MARDGLALLALETESSTIEIEELIYASMVTMGKIHPLVMTSTRSTQLPQ